MSGLFEASVVAVSPDDDLDLDALLGSGAALRLGSSDEGATFRAWTGVVSYAEQIEVEPSGGAAYYLRIVPMLWRTSRRRNNRIFQHLSLPQIAASVLSEWAIEPTMELDLSSFARLEYRVQYAETDLAFVSRTLEEAGIAYCFRDPDPSKEGSETALVLSTDAQRADPREAGPLLFSPGKDIAHPASSIWDVRFVENVRPGRITLRDYDFRSRPDFQLIAEARSQVPVEDRFEHYEYVPGAFLVEPDGGRAARVDEKYAQGLAARQLSATRQGKRSIVYQTNALDLVPGTVFTIAGHPRRELAIGKALLVVDQTINGARDGEWIITGRAVLADEPYRPFLTTPKPRIFGVQSALVVGPAGEEIHTDEHGRVRVQFHWDREGKRDEKSSCFVRVSQAWAGHGFGVHAVPRIGDEVLVGFFEGDPDQPIVVGRVHNSAARVPLGLPGQKTRSTWRSESTPGGGGWNEITFEDLKGKELLYVQAERDHERLVKQNESVTIGASLETSIGASESREITSDQSIIVGGNRTSSVTGTETISVGQSFKLDLGGGAAGIAVTSDKRIVLSTGEASIVLDGPNIFFDGAASVRLSSEVVAIGGGEVHVDGGPNLFLNSSSAAAPGPASFAGALDAAGEVVIPKAPEEEAFDDLLSKPAEEPGAAPEAVTLPAHVDEQLRAARDKILHGVEEVTAKVMERAEMIQAKIKKIGEDLVPRVEKARAEINAKIEALRGQIEKVKAEAAAQIAKLKAEVEKIWAEVQARIDKAKEIIDRAKEAVARVKERIEEAKTRVRETIANIKQRIQEVKDNAKARFDDLRKRAIQVRNDAQNVIDEVKGAIDHAKQQAKQLVDDVKTTIEHAKQHVKDIVADLKNDNLSLKDRLKAAFNDGKALVADAKADGAKVGSDYNSLVGDAKENAAKIQADAKQVASDAKQLGKDAVSDAKTTIDEAKQAAKDSAAEVKETAADLKDQAKGATQDVKDAYGDIKDQAKDLFGKAPLAGQAGEAASEAGKAATDAGKVAGDAGKAATDAGKTAGDAASQAGAVVPYSAKSALPGAGGPIPPLGAGGPQAPPITVPNLGGPPPPAAPASSIVTRSGGFGANSVANSVNQTPGATFLQSPNEGQLMIVRTQAARPIAAEHLGQSVVEHQMSGMPSSDAYAAALEEHGYAIYERPWDSVGGSFIQKAVL